MPQNWSRGSVSRLSPALRSFITSPPTPQATATTVATRKRLVVEICLKRTCTRISTKMPNISIGSMPVEPTSQAAR